MPVLNDEVPDNDDYDAGRRRGEFDNITKYAIQPTVVSRFCVVAPVEAKRADNKGAMVKVTNS